MAEVLLSSVVPKKTEFTEIRMSDPPTLFYIKVKDIRSELQGHMVDVEGWVTTVREQKDHVFVKMSDGSCLDDLQIVIDKHLYTQKLLTHCTIRVVGKVVQSPSKGQHLEVVAREVYLVGSTKEHDLSTYPMAKTQLPLLYLRQYPHLRIRTKTMQAVMKIRSQLSLATHAFFSKRSCVQVFTPIMTSSDCEGAGETFKVKTDYKPEIVDGKEVDPFFTSGEHFLTVSGQLDLETYACGGFGDVYTFGPCFRAEKSDTSRHLAEFWMVEAELIKTDLDKLITFAEDYVRFCLQYVLDTCTTELIFMDKYWSAGLVDRLSLYAKLPFKRIEYRDAIKRIGVPFGTDLTSEQEKKLVSELHDPPLPTFVMRYPQSIKAFYMKKDVEETVQSFDLLFPGIGELIGGSMREEDLELLTSVMQSRQMPLDKYKQYLDLRKYGSISHGGFGLGMERLCCIATGMESVRDVVPFPVYYKS